MTFSSILPLKEIQMNINELEKLHKHIFRNCPFSPFPHKPSSTTLTPKTLEAAYQTFWNNVRQHFFTGKQCLQQLIQNINLHRKSQSESSSLENDQSPVPITDSSEESVKSVIRHRYWERLGGVEKDNILSRVYLGGRINRGLVEKKQLFNIIKQHSKRIIKQNKLLKQAITEINFSQDQLLQQIHALEENLHTQHKHNSNKLIRLQKKVLKEVPSHDHRGKEDLIAYYNLTLSEMEQKQLAESIAYFEETFTRCKKIYSRVHFQEALDWQPRCMLLSEIQQLSKIREIPLLQYFTLSQKTTFSTSSFYEPANSAIVPKQVVPKGSDIFKSKGRGKGQMKICFCHQCRLIFARNAIYECGYELKGAKCGRFYCPTCIKLFYGESEVCCFSCYQMCNCTRCQREARMQKLRATKRQIEQWDQQSQTNDAEFRKKPQKRLSVKRYQPTKRKRTR